MTTGDLNGASEYVEKVGEEPLTIFAAAEKGDVAALDEALRNGEPIDSKNDKNETPLIIAAQNLRTDAVNHLLERGADTNAKKLSEDTALHWAAFKGDKDLVMQLLAYGADPDAVGEYKNRPLHLACTGHHQEIVAILLTRGASVLARNEYGVTPYNIATNQTVKDLVLSVEKGGDVARSKLRITMAQTAAIEAEEKRKALSKAKADMDAKLAHEEAVKKKRSDEAEAERLEEVGKLNVKIGELSKELNDLKKAEEERLKKEEEERLKAEAEAAAKKGKKKKGKK